MSDFSKKVIMETTIPLCIAAVLAVGILFFGKTISEQKNHIISARESLVEWAALTQSYASINAQYVNKAKAYMSALENIFPPKDFLIDLRKEFQLLASAENVGMNFAFAGDREVSSSVLGAVGFTMNLQASGREQLVNFIKRVENFRYLVSIEYISYEAKEDGISSLIRGRVYYRQP